LLFRRARGANLGEAEDRFRHNRIDDSQAPQSVLPITTLSTVFTAVANDDRFFAIKSSDSIIEVEQVRAEAEVEGAHNSPLGHSTVLVFFAKDCEMVEENLSFRFLS
jgi:hypothetical protein